MQLHEIIVFSHDSSHSMSKLNADEKTKNDEPIHDNIP